MAQKFTSEINNNPPPTVESLENDHKAKIEACKRCKLVALLIIGIPVVIACAVMLCFLLGWSTLTSIFKKDSPIFDSFTFFVGLVDYFILCVIIVILIGLFELIKLIHGYVMEPFKNNQS